MKTVRWGDHLIGEGQPVFIIAEIGYNFTNNDEALKSIDAAKACGADAVKFQTFRAETVASRFSDFPVEAGSSNQFDEFKRYEISEESHRLFFEHSRRLGILAFSTPSHPDDVDLLERLHVPIHKVGSDDLTNLPFLEYIARTGKPILLSTGMGTLAEVEESVQTIRSAGNDHIVVLQCLSNYPVKDFRGVNLRAMNTLGAALHVPVGYSDHTTTLSASLGAVALGASVIEKHFTLDKKLPVPDAFFSADPAEFRKLVEAVRELEAALGDGIKRPAASELSMREETRKSLIAREPIAVGEELTEANTIVKRPGTGIPPKMRSVVLGRVSRQALKKDEVITWEKIR